MWIKIEILLRSVFIAFTSRPWFFKVILESNLTPQYKQLHNLVGMAEGPVGAMVFRFAITIISGSCFRMDMFKFQKWMNNNDFIKRWTLLPVGCNFLNNWVDFQQLLDSLTFNSANSGFIMFLLIHIFFINLNQLSILSSGKSCSTSTPPEFLPDFLVKRIWCTAASQGFPDKITNSMYDGAPLNVWLGITEFNLRLWLELYYMTSREYKKSPNFEILAFLWANDT